MKRWIQISMLSILIACVANIGYLNSKTVDLKKDIKYTQNITMLNLDKLHWQMKTMDSCLYDQMARRSEALWNKITETEKSTVASVVEAVISSVVYIEVKGKIQDQNTGKMVDSHYFGTGFVYNKDGLILTAGHLINNMKLLEGPVMIVKCYKGDVFEVLNTTLIDREEDPNLPDIGLIKINTKGIELNPVILGEKDLSLGETIISIGHPRSLIFSVSTGIVSRLGNTPFYLNGFYLQTDTATNPGNSGSPIFGLDGKVYGISIFVLRFDKRMVLEGLNFATPVSVVNENTQKMIEELECGVVND